MTFEPRRLGMAVDDASGRVTAVGRNVVDALDGWSARSHSLSHNIGRNRFSGGRDTGPGGLEGHSRGKRECNERRRTGRHQDTDADGASFYGLVLYASVHGAGRCQSLIELSLTSSIDLP